MYYNVEEQKIKYFEEKPRIKFHGDNFDQTLEILCAQTSFLKSRDR